MEKIDRDSWLDSDLDMELIGHSTTTDEGKILFSQELYHCDVLIWSGLRTFESENALGSYQDGFIDAMSTIFGELELTIKEKPKFTVYKEGEVKIDTPIMQYDPDGEIWIAGIRIPRNEQIIEALRKLLEE